MANSTVLDERLTNARWLKWEGRDQVIRVAELALLRSFDQRRLLQYSILKRIKQTVTIRSIPLLAQAFRLLRSAAKGE